MGMASRASDDLILKAVRLRCKGMGPADVGRVIGKSSQFVSTACNRVRLADLAESGEKRAKVLRKYWDE